MSNQSGITASEKLNNFLSKCRDGRYRLIKICISSSAQPQLELEVYNSYLLHRIIDSFPRVMKKRNKRFC